MSARQSRRPPFERVDVEQPSEAGERIVKVGGRKLVLTAQEVIVGLAAVFPEPIHEHIVRIGGRDYPPKQALESVTGWDRSTFTTLEARRVFRQLGFPCLRAGDQLELPRVEGTAATADVMINALKVAQLAIAHLDARIRVLEESQTKTGRDGTSEQVGDA